MNLNRIKTLIEKVEAQTAAVQQPGRPLRWTREQIDARYGHVIERVAATMTDEQCQQLQELRPILAHLRQLRDQQ